jgi:hypothetical protein
MIALLDGAEAFPADLGRLRRQDCTPAVNGLRMSCAGHGPELRRSGAGRLIGTVREDLLVLALGKGASCLMAGPGQPLVRVDGEDLQDRAGEHPEPTVGAESRARPPCVTSIGSGRPTGVKVRLSQMFTLGGKPLVAM